VRTRRPLAVRLVSFLLVGGWLVGGVLVGCTGGGSGSSTTGTGRRLPMAGFADAAVQVRSAAGTVAQWCALLADDEASRAKGMMGQDDLHGYDAMVFRHPQPSTGAYYMFQTTIPLSIAWFDASGRFVSSADMEPCPASDSGACPLYRAAGPYRLAVEVLEGNLGTLGIGPGSQLEVLGTTGCGA
jgi:uncharacterized membrane protein (UPF0127 family)